MWTPHSHPHPHAEPLSSLYQGCYGALASSPTSQVQAAIPRSQRFSPAATALSRGAAKAESGLPASQTLPLSVCPKA